MLQMVNSPPAEGAPSDEETTEEHIALFYTSEFKRNVRRLAKKYRRIRQDIQPIIEQLPEGQTPGTQIPRVSYPVFKVRTKNSDAQRGTSGGYRMLYSKSEQGDIAPEAIRQIIEEYGADEAQEES